MRRILGVEHDMFCLFLGDLVLVTIPSNSKSSLLLLFGRCGVSGDSTIGETIWSKGFGEARLYVVVSGEKFEKGDSRSPSILCRARQLAIKPTTGDFTR